MTIPTRQHPLGHRLGPYPDIPLYATPIEYLDANSEITNGTYKINTNVYPNTSTTGYSIKFSELFYPASETTLFSGAAMKVLNSDGTFTTYGWGFGTRTIGGWGFCMAISEALKNHMIASFRNALNLVIYSGFNGQTKEAWVEYSTKSTKKEISDIGLDLQYSEPFYLFTSALDPFGSTYQDAPPRDSNLRIYNFSMTEYDNETDSNTVIRDFVPVRIGDKGCFFDRVTKQFFKNEGSGEFILGPDLT